METLLPDWLGIGVVKCGTSWAWQNLKRHPQVFAPDDKESHFFNAEPVRKFNKYLSQFAAVPPDIKKGEWTPDYFHHYEARHNIKERCPQVNLVTIFRQPVDRAFSNWKHAMNSDRLPGGTTFAQSFRFWRIRERGVYARYLKQWYKVFPKEQIKVMFYDDIVNDPGGFMADLYRFIGVDDSFVPKDIDKQFRFSYHDTQYDKVKLPPEERTKWAKYYLPHIVELEKLTGRNLDSWKS